MKTLFRIITNYIDRKRREGFTLIELAMVVVVIGLVVSGIVVGKDLIRAAQFRSIMSDAEKLQVAAMTFKMKFNEMPGDFTKASQFWGTNCQKSGYYHYGSTCNGNGNKLIGSYHPEGSSHATEAYMFWRHLFLADLLSLDVTGVCGADPRCSGITGLNIPSTAFNMGMYVVNDGLGQARNTNRLIIADYTANNASFGSVPKERLPWSNEEVRRIDAKFDDGLPQSGRITGMYIINPGSASCFTSGAYNNWGGANGGCGISFDRWIE